MKGVKSVVVDHEKGTARVVMRPKAKLSKKALDKAFKRSQYGYSELKEVVATKRRTIRHDYKSGTPS